MILKSLLKFRLIEGCWKCQEDDDDDLYYGITKILTITILIMVDALENDGYEENYDDNHDQE